jgi:3'-phosphoadenosine 5'-phosphosulfate sulfotransferase (PAPS reductase)/FAD synthetase
MAWADVVLVNTSAGKDSQSMLDLVCRQLAPRGDLGKVIAVHADLGRVEWAGTRELAQRQAEQHGVEFRVCRGPDVDLLQRVEQRRMWPSNTARYCTSDFKRSAVLKVMTALAREWKPRLNGRRLRILNLIGYRAEESPARRKKLGHELILNARATNKTKRLVWDWYPVLSWSEARVWDSIRASGVEHHRAYDLGMPRLSCVFCVFAPRAALLLAGEHNPELLDEYCRVEDAIGHDFRKGFRINEIREAFDAGERASDLSVWTD